MRRPTTKKNETRKVKKRQRATAKLHCDERKNIDDDEMKIALQKKLNEIISLAFYITELKNKIAQCENNRD